MASKRARQRVDALVAAGVNPTRLKGSEAIALVQGRSRVKLVEESGRASAAGRYWAKKTGEPLPDGGFMKQQAVREGNSEFIRLRNGTKVLVRRWDEATGKYSFTRIGNAYYRTLRRNYVASVPVIVTGRRRNNTTYKYKTHLPIEKLGLRPREVPMNMQDDERHQLVKNLILTDLPRDGVIYEFSEEAYEYDPNGGWLISEETVGTHPDTNKAESHVVLDRPVGARPLPPATMLFAEAVCEEAFKDYGDMLCVPRQLAAVLRKPFDEILEQLRETQLTLQGADTIEVSGCSPRLVLEFCRARGYGAAVVHNEEVIETIPGKPVVAFTVHEGHAYFYESPQVRRSLQQRRPGGVARIRKAQAATTTPPMSEWKEWTGEITPGHFYASEEDLPTIRAWFLSWGKSVKVLMKDTVRPRGLLYHMTRRLDGEPGVVYIHGLPEQWRTIADWAERLGFEYRGEGLPACSMKVLLGLVKRGRERVYLNGEQKAELLELFDYKCATCGSRSSSLEWDHVARLSEGYGPQEFQPLCAQCHSEKTAAESRSLDTDLLASSFNLHTWKQYVDSPRPPPLVYRVRDLPEGSLEGFEIADVRRCRKRALERSVHDLPMFCVFDDVRPRETLELGDLCFVAKPYRHFIHQLGYSGPGWQHRVQTEWLLHTGVISWDDITHTLTATSRFPAGLLQEPLARMESAWDGNPLAKVSVNSLIGLWCIDETKSYKCRSSRCDSDCPPGAVKQIFRFGENEEIFDFITAETLVANSSCRPLHDLCMCTEHTRVGQMLYVLRQCRAIPYELKTDSCLFRPRKRRKAPIGELRFCDLSSLRAHFEPPAPGMRRLDERALLAHNPCTEEVFRCFPAQDADRMRSNPELPQRAAAAPEVLQRSWADLDEAAAEERLMRGESLLVLGIAGTGKTTFCRGAVERLRTAGKKVEIISKTHTAAKRAGGVTADFWVRRHILHGVCTCDVLWIDEVSQLDVGLWSQLAKLAFVGTVCFLMSGDFNQFPPLSNYWRGAAVSEAAFEESTLLYTLAGGNRCTLTECRRGERELFDFYSSLIAGGSRFSLPVSEAVRAARQVFRHTGQARWNLCISHRKRIEINRTQNRAAAPGDCVFLEVRGRPAQGNAAQSMLVWPGLELLGCVAAEKKGIRNGCIYTVESIDTAAETLRLQGLDTDFTFDQVKQWLRLSFAQTYASCQGTEFGDSLRLHDCGSRFFTRRHLFVGLSRARVGTSVSLRD